MTEGRCGLCIQGDDTRLGPVRALTDCFGAAC
jgi:hypothetical protein